MPVAAMTVLVFHLMIAVSNFARPALRPALVDKWLRSLDTGLAAAGAPYGPDSTTASSQ